MDTNQVTALDPAEITLPSTAQRVENCLRAMSAVMADRAIPLHVRDEVCVAHRKLHACRDELTVRRMEVKMGLKK